MDHMPDKKTEENTASQVTDKGHIFAVADKSTAGVVRIYCGSARYTCRASDRPTVQQCFDSTSATGNYHLVPGNEWYVRFFRERAEAKRADRTDPDSEYRLQRWLAIAQSIQLPKSELLNNYYYDEFIAMMDEYNDMHTPESERVEEVYADDFW